jgi:hypothetical protein
MSMNISNILIESILDSILDHILDSLLDSLLDNIIDTLLDKIPDSVLDQIRYILFYLVNYLIISYYSCHRLLYILALELFHTESLIFDSRGNLNDSKVVLSIRFQT